MNNFIKKNLFLVGVLGLAALCVLILLVLSVMQTIEMRKYIQRTEDMRAKNEKLMRQRPPAVKENIALIQKDIDGYQVKGEEMKQFFGQTLNPALLAFCEKIHVDKQELCDLFKTFWDKEKETLGPREQTYRRFRATLGKIGEGKDKALWDLNTWDEALDFFVAKAQETTMEKIDERNREEIFLSSLGLPRNLGNDERRLEVFVRSMQSGVVDLLENKKVSMLGVYFTSSGISELKTDENFDDQGRRGSTGKNDDGVSGSSRSSGGAGMSEIGNRSGSDGDSKKVEPSDVIRNWEIMSDLAKRIADAKLESLEKLSFGDLTGKENGNCTFYTYEFTVRGSQKAIRDFINNLNMAYKENRLYVIRNLSFRKIEDQTQDMMDMAKGILAAPNKDAETELSTDNADEPGMGSIRPRRSRGGKSDEMDGGIGMNTSQKQVAQDYFTEQNIYGEIVVGRSEQCEATFTVDYVVFTANILK